MTAARRSPDRPRQTREPRAGTETRIAAIDIGSNSVRQIVADVTPDGVLDELVSLPLGALRLTERYFRDGVTTRALRQLRKEVRRAVRDVISTRDWRGAQVIGSGGTFTNLGGMHLARQKMLAARNVHATKIPRTEVEHLLDAMASMSTEERREMPGLNPGRADIIVAGVAVAAEVLARVDARDLVVSRYGIREGILLETARVRATAADPGEARERSVREFAERCHYEAPHAQQVQRLALRLFDALGERLGCSDEDRTLLGDAALLHDVGYHISYDRHHKHAYHLILHAELLGVAPAEQVVMANVARYHRGAEPKRKHRNFGELSPAMRGRVRKLAALLRVADGFDRGHIGAVAELKVRRMKRANRITAVAPPGADNIPLDIFGAHRKSELLARVAGIPLEIVSPDGDVFSSDAVEAGANE